MLQRACAFPNCFHAGGLRVPMSTSGVNPNPVRRYLGLALFLGSAAALFLMMAHEGHLWLATLWGLLALLGASLGLFAFLGLLHPAGDRDVKLSDTWLGALPGELPWLAPARTLPAMVVLLIGCAALAPAGLPAAVLIGLALQLPAALRGRPGLLVFSLGSALLLPTLGTFHLWDPWETHYGEVAREILARDDWISLWWAQDKWFWSKPILIFWAEALTWNATTVPFTPDSQFAHSEWILRLPIYACGITSLVVLQGVIGRRFGQRAGVLSATVLATTPYFAFLGHQAITDMYLVSFVTIAVMLLLAAAFEDPERPSRGVRLMGYSLSAQHLCLGLLLALALPQAIYLLSRNCTLVDGFLFAWHRDDFIYGSAGNAGVPGNPQVRLRHPVYNGLALQPAAQALGWLSCLGVLVHGLRRERRVQPLLMTGFYLCCALAFMGKGIPGIALPGLAALLFLLSTGRWSLLLDGKLRVGHGLLVILTVAMPWFVAMFVRHGPAFTDRLLIHDHINRLTRGVHGDTGSIKYFIEQLGTGLFPWIALCPAALGLWLARAGRAGEVDADPATRRDALFAIGLWFGGTFTLFSAMTTKFHHYIFPAVPPAAILIGLTLDRMMGTGRRFATPQGRAGLLLASLSSLCLVAGIGGAFGDLRGVIPADVSGAERSVWVLQQTWPAWASALLVMAGLFMWLLADRFQRVGGAVAVRDVGLGGALLVGAMMAGLAGRDLSWATSDRPAGNERLAHLFIYNYTRPWPEELDYRPILSGFACTLVLIVVLAAFVRLRALMAQALVGLGVLFCLFCLDVYMLDATRHWTQGHLVRRYYNQRKGPEEPLVAWQMNWKGENYYTGNRVHVFQDLDNKKITKWLEKNSGRHAYFILEHKRLSRFERMMKPRKVRALSDVRDCNKFVLVEADL